MDFQYGYKKDSVDKQFKYSVESQYDVGREKKRLRMSGEIRCSFTSLIVKHGNRIRPSHL